MKRTTVTLKKNIVDELMKRTKAKVKSKAVVIAIEDYLRKQAIKEMISSMKGKLKFDLTAEELRHEER